MIEEAMHDYERYKNIFRGMRMPLAFVDTDRFDENVKYVGGTQKNNSKTVRVHTKSLRCRGLTGRALSVGGEKFKGLMTFSAAETRWLAESGFNDFILAYPTVQKADLEDLAAISASGVMISTVVDSIEHLKELSEAGVKAGTVAGACLEIDVSFRPFGNRVHLGPRRSPIRSAEQAVSLAKQASSLKGVRIDSIMAYEAHIASTADARRGENIKNTAVSLMKVASMHELSGRRAGIVDALEGLGLKLRLVNGGGSGSLVSTGADPTVTEVTAGSAFYAPALFHDFAEVHFKPAAFFALQVVRKPAHGIVTCQGGGYIASGSAGSDRLPRPVFPEGLEYLPMEGAGEVQTPLKVPDGVRLAVGDPVFFQHAKAGELCERFNELHMLQSDRIIGTVKTYRGEDRCFL